MNYKTADQLGQDAVFALVQDRTLTRRIFALLSSGIQISEGVIELLASGNNEREILTAFFMDPELKQVGAKLTSEKLREMLLPIMREKNKRRLKGRALENASFDETVRSLGLHLDLTTASNTEENTANDVSPANADIIDVDFEEADDIMDFTVIALRDEVDASKGTRMLVRQQQNLTRHGTQSIFSFPDMEAKLNQGLQEEALRWGRILFTLPMISVADEFEKNIRSLGPVMHAPNMRDQFIAQTTLGFVNRPMRSRKVIAEVMRDYLNPRLMDNIVYLCDPERPENLQIEAINHLLGHLQSASNAAEITLTAVSLVKTMEENDRPGARAYVFVKLSEKVDLIRHKLPNFLHECRVIPMLKTVLLADPDTFKEPIRRFVLGFAKEQSHSIAAELRENLALTSDQTVVAIYLGLLQEIEQDAAAREIIEAQRWANYFEHQHAHPALAKDFITEIETMLPASLATPMKLFLSWDEGKQTHFVKLCDNLFTTALSKDGKNSLVARKVALFFHEMTKNCDQFIRLVIAATETALCPELEIGYHRHFWPTINEHLTTLTTDPTFIARFASSGYVHLTDFIGHIVGTSRDDVKKRLLPIAGKKILAVRADIADRPDQLAATQETISLTLGEIATLIEGAKRISEAETLFHLYIDIMRSPLLDKELFCQHLLKLPQATQGKEKLQTLVVESYASFAKSHLQSREIAEFLRDNFLKFFKENIPKKSTMSGDFSPVEPIVVAAVEGMSLLCQSGQLLAGHVKALIRVMRRQVDDRPTVKTGYLMKDGIKQPPREVEDPFKDLLVATLAKVDPSEDKDLI